MLIQTNVYLESERCSWYVAVGKVSKRWDSYPKNNSVHPKIVFGFKNETYAV